MFIMIIKQFISWELVLPRCRQPFWEEVRTKYSPPLSRGCSKPEPSLFSVGTTVRWTYHVKVYDLSPSACRSILPEDKEIPSFSRMADLELRKADIWRVLLASVLLILDSHWSAAYKANWSMESLFAGVTLIGWTNPLCPCLVNIRVYISVFVSLCHVIWGTSPCPPHTTCIFR